MDRSGPGGPRGPQPPLVDQERSGPPWTTLQHFPDALQSAFRATGLIPFDPSIIISKLREAVPLITHSPAEDPAPSSSGISLNIPSLRVQGAELLCDAKNMPAEFQLRLKKVL